MSSARAASELRGLSTASTSDEEEEGECVCSTSGGPHLLASCFILSSTLMWNWEEFPRPSTTPRPCLAAVRHMTKDSVVPTLTKKKSYMLACGGWPGLKWKIAGWDCWRGFEADPLWVSTEAGSRETRTRLLSHRAHSGCISNETRP